MLEKVKEIDPAIFIISEEAKKQVRDSLTCACGDIVNFEIGLKKERACLKCMVRATMGPFPVLVRKINVWEDTP